MTNADQTKFMKSDSAERARFVQHLLDDVEALELMLAEGWFERDRQRIGAEQEFCLIDYALRPSMSAMEVLSALDDKHFTTELAKFNLELNLDPLNFGADCLTALENDLVRLLTRANRAAHGAGAKIILTGILPTVRSSDLVIENITPIPRYRALNDALRGDRGEDFSVNIRGADELITSPQTVLFEGCNTSFQVHLQIDPAQFVEHYNWAQAIAGPVLSAATNSPLLLGKRLWMETRIAVFRQSTDPRRRGNAVRDARARVTFGKAWERGSLLNIYRELVSRFRVLLTPHIEQDALAMYRNGEVPALQALSFHNGTVYRWNRPCYGTTDGKPHIRIENRYLPSGPSIVDEVANAALWLGLMQGRPRRYDGIAAELDFDEAKTNFLKAAESGLAAQFRWTDGGLVPAQRLLLDELLPIAREGLSRVGVVTADIDKYLGIIEERVSSGQTGSQWQLSSFARLRREGSADEAVVAITEGIYQRQKAGLPVHRWTPVQISEGGGWKNRFSSVQQLMSTDLISVGEQDPVELIKNIMLWSHIHHMPVESADGRLVGVVSMSDLLRHAERLNDDTLVVADVMARDPLTVTPETSSADALRLMQQHESACLPVLSEGRLVGILTNRDYVKIARGVLREPR